jgi:hypothetical protein
VYAFLIFFGHSNKKSEYANLLPIRFIKSISFLLTLGAFGSFSVGWFGSFKT